MKHKTCEYICIVTIIKFNLLKIWVNNCKNYMNNAVFIVAYNLKIIHFIYKLIKIYS